MTRLIFALTYFMSHGSAVELAPPIMSAATRYNVDPYLVAAVIHTESRFTNGLCYKGAYGYMQVQTRYRVCDNRSLLSAKWDGLDRPETNIEKGVRLMALWRSWCTSRHGHLRGSRRHHWLLHYNQGFGVCRRGKKCSKEDRIPVTRGHVGGYADRVLRVYRLLKERGERARTS